MIIVGVDTGGTFTDFVCYENGKWYIFKIPSTPENPAKAVIKGLKTIGKKQKSIIHGTTVATNTLLERKGAKTALITNKGFEDIIEIGRQNREKLYDLYYKREKIPVERKHRFGIDCRINSKGEILKDIEEKELKNLIKNLKKHNIESVAVSFLFSFLNPYHEKLVKEYIQKHLDIPVSASHEVLPEFREFERTATTVINAYVLPKMKTYLTYLQNNIQPEDTLKVMQSNGGSISVDTASKEPVRTILSGPAGGVIGALSIGNISGYKKLITFDMGGTSTDVSLIDEKPTYTTETKVAGLPVKVQMIDIYTIGAGGGSIAYIDEGGALRVGPESAGAEPGPVCYGKGKRLTVTDANLFLGRIVPEYFLGGKMKLYPEKVKEKFIQLSKETGLSPTELAEGIITVANSNMQKAIRAISVERGYNPSNFYLFTYGGAGGLHAVELAKDLNIPAVIVPQNPGILSAFGMLMADVVKDYSITVMINASYQETTHIDVLFNKLIEKAKEELKHEPVEKIIFEKYLDMRYKGQSYEITIPFKKNFIDLFFKKHKQMYGYADDKKPIEIVNIRLKAIGITKKPSIKEEKKKKKFTSSAILNKLKIIYNQKEYETYIIDRNKLSYGNELPSPSIVVEYSSTTFIPPYAKAYVDKFKNLIIKI